MVKHSLSFVQCDVSFCSVILNIHFCYAARAFLIFWQEEDSVSVTRRDDIVVQACQPTVGDVEKIKFQRQVYEGIVAEVGTLYAIKSKAAAFLRGEYTPFSHKRPASPPSELTHSKQDKENIMPQRSGRGHGRGRGGGKSAQAEVGKLTGMVVDME